MAGEVVVDALPYIDQGYDDPGVREAALSMVEEECRRYRPTKNYLEQLPPLSVAQSTATFETPMLRRELERLNARLPPEPLSMKRYELPPPVAGRLSDVTAWTEAVDNSLAQLEHQATRVVNLELQLDYACETWRAYLEVITKMVSGAQCRLTGLRKETASVNWDRKSIQTAMGSKLRGLEQAWVQLVSHNYLLERAIAELEVEVANAQAKEKEDVIESEPEPSKVKELLDSAIDKAYGVEAPAKKEAKKRPSSSKSKPKIDGDQDESESSESKKVKSDPPHDIFAE